jgi:hypothetical protein
MRVYVHHDASGKIRSFVVNRGNLSGVTATLTPRRGLFITEIDDLDEKVVADPAALRKLAETHVVQKVRAVSKLIPI